MFTKEDLTKTEKEFLELKEIQKHLQLKKIATVTNQISTATKKRFDASVNLGLAVHKAYDWIRSEKGALALETAGIEWKTDDIAEKCFGFKKSYMLRLVNVGKIVEAEPQVKEEFEQFCDENEGVKRNLVTFIKYSKKGADECLPKEANGDGDGGNDDGELKQETPKGNCIGTFSFKTNDSDGNPLTVAARIEADGKLDVISHNTRDEIKAALIEYLAILEDEATTIKTQ